MAKRNKHGRPLRSRDVVGSTAEKGEPVEALRSGGVLVEAIGPLGRTVGFYDGRRIRAGERFLYYGEKLGKWMRPVGPSRRDSSASSVSGQAEATGSAATGDENPLGDDLDLWHE